MTPLVSILIPCYNSEQWIGQAIESALAQSYSRFETIVVDDGSTDGSLAVIRSFGDRIRYETGPNRGGNATRNRLLELSRGDWLQYLDADDALLPTKVATQVEFMQREAPDADVIYSPSIIRDESANPMHERVLPIPEPHDPWVLLARWYLPQTGAPLWRKTTVERVGKWKVDQPVCQEHELYLRLLAGGAKFVYSPAAESIYRIWSLNTICRRDPSETRRRRLQIIADLERHLDETGELNALRASAIASARLEIARGLWMSDRQEARRLASLARSSAPRTFQPSGVAFPPMYRKVYSALGFEMAERIAAVRRSIGAKT